MRISTAERWETATSTPSWAAGAHWLERLLDSSRVRIPLLVLLGLLLVVRISNMAVGIAGPAWGYDFSAYWLAGRHVLDGQPLYTYAQLAGTYPPQQQYLYLYPPLFAVVMTPISAMFADYRTAMWLWAAIDLLLLVAAVAALAKSAQLPRRTTFLVIGAALALPAVGFELVMGNVNILLLGLLAMAWLGLRQETQRGEIVAGSMVGIAALIKIFPIVVVLWFLLTRRYTAALAAVATMALLAVATVPLVGLAQWLDFPRVLSNLGPPTDPSSSVSPVSLLSAFVSFDMARLIVTASGLAILAWSTAKQETAISFSVAIMVSLLIVPTIYPHSLALAVLPLILLAGRAQTALGTSLAYAALLIGGQAALIDLRVPVLRGLALLGAVAPLVALLDGYRRGRA